MKKLITCLGFNPNNDGIILPILENRLVKIIEVCRENPNSVLVLMGGNTFRKPNPDSVDQSLEMKKYIEANAPDVIQNTKIILKNKYTTTIRELCGLREINETEYLNLPITIVVSEFFIQRVKLYAEYIFGNIENIDFVASKVPEESAASFKQIEELKLEKGHQWLDGYVKGDYKKLLEEQDAFEKKILSGEVDHPVSK